MENRENPWKTLGGKLVYENQWIRVDEYDVITPTGTEGIYGQVSFKNQAVGILPVDEEGNTWLVGQYRYTLNAYSWEIPMGGVPFSQKLEEGALRELKEETGLIAGKLELFMRIHTSNSVTNEEGFVFLAKELEQAETEFDDTEDIEIKKVTMKEALDMVLSSEITDSLSVAAILKYARHLGI